jgi:hypothetical protein
MSGEIPEGNEAKGKITMMQCVFGCPIDPSKLKVPDGYCSVRHHRLSKRVDRHIERIKKYLEKKLKTGVSLKLNISICDDGAKHGIWSIEKEI